MRKCIDGHFSAKKMSVFRNENKGQFNSIQFD